MHIIHDLKWEGICIGRYRNNVSVAHDYDSWANALQWSIGP